MRFFARVVRFSLAYRRALFLPVIPVVWLVFSLFGVIAEPFGTEQLSLSGRLVFWPVMVGFAIFIGAALRVLVRDYIGWRSYPIEAPAIALLAAVVLTPLCMGMAELLADTGNYVPSWPSVATYVFILSMATSALRHAFAAQWPKANAQGPDEPGLYRPERLAVPPPCGPRILARITPDLQAPLVRLQVRNHYVDVVTVLGCESLLLRLADAIAETEGVDGLQVHRSHWVARAHILGLQRSGGKLLLRMRDGAVVPVSRRHLGVVQGFGLQEIVTPLEAQLENPARQKAE